MKPFIFTEVTADYPAQCTKDAFEVIPMSFSLDEDDYDNITTFLSAKEFYGRMKAGAKTNTAMISEVVASEAIEKRLKEGYDVLYIVFSSALSGSYNVAARVCNELAAKYPARKLAFIDSRNASMGEGLLTYYALQKRDEGVSFEQLVEYTRGLVDSVCSYFTVDDLKHLARLGRVTKTAAFIGSIVQIKPVLYVNRLGELVPVEKVVSRKKSLKGLVDKMEAKMLDVDKQSIILIGHGDCYDDAVYVQKQVEERFGLKNFVISDIGPVIGSHAGQGVVALFFLGKDKIEASDARVNGRAETAE